MHRWLRAPRWPLAALLALVLAAGITGGASAPPAQTTAGPAAVVAQSAAASRLHDAAGSLVSRVKTTRYAHHWKANEATGHYEADCSYLVAQLLGEAAPRALAAVPREKGAARPRAFLFHRFFDRLERDGPRDGWTAVPRLADSLPGDVLAWTNEPFDPGDNTGHVMIVAGLPTPLPDGRWRLTVIDATGSPHDDDTRTGGGIGRGDIYLTVDATGTPVTVQLRSGIKPFARPLSIGRLT